LIVTNQGAVHRANALPHPAELTRAGILTSILRGRVTDIVLLHSPLVGPSSLAPTANALRTRGHRCLVPSPRALTRQELPWRDWPAALLAEIGDVSAPVIVGHSMGGLLAARLASDLRAAAMICLDASMPPESGPTPPVGPAFRATLEDLPVTDGFLPPWHEWWSGDAFEGAQVTPEVRALVVAEIPRLRKDWFDDEFQMQDWSATKRAFIRTGKWFDSEADKAAALGWPVVRLQGTHLHPTTCPEETASAIIRCIEALDIAC
jgi:pimeloyl-ACP methyl ester carboxylesterase